MQSKKLPQLEEYFSYDRLEKASKKLHLNPTVPENEERLMNFTTTLYGIRIVPEKTRQRMPFSVPLFEM